MRTAKGTAYTVSGQGRDLVFIHGLFSSKESFSKAIPLLSSGYRVWAYDIHGYGSSARTGKYDLSAQVRQLDEFLTEKSVSMPILVGHSMGGGIAQAFAATHPGRAAHVVLVNSVDLRQYPRFWNPRKQDGDPRAGTLIDLAFGLLHQRWVRPIVRFYSSPFLVGAILGSLYRYRRNLDARVVAGYHSPLLSGEFWDELPKLVRFERDPALDQILERVRRHGSKVSILWGRHDPWFGAEHAAGLASLHAVAVVHFVESAGHLPQEEAPEEFSEVLRGVIG